MAGAASEPGHTTPVGQAGTGKEGAGRQDSRDRQGKLGRRGWGRALEAPSRHSREKEAGVALQRTRQAGGRQLTMVGRLAWAAVALCAAGSLACGAAESRQAEPAGPGSAEFKLYHEVHGEGPPLVLAHGGGGTHLIWWQQVPAFSQSFKVITFDHRGFGFSVDVPGGPGRAAFVDDLRDLLDRLGIQETALVGQSMGGRTVLGFAAAHPERVTHLVLSSTSGGYTDPDLEAVRASAPSLGPRSAFSAAFAERDPDRAFLYRSISRTNDYLSPPVEADAAPPASVPDIQRVVAAGIPTLFIIGERDTVAVPSVLEAMHRKMAGSQMVKLPDSGHSPYFELPETFNRIVLEFVQTGRVSTGS
jgi:3-oxoadipate enol-lactonase